MLVLACLGGAASTTAAQGSEATVSNCVLLVLQGENDFSTGSEGKNDFYALKILGFDLPHDVSRVYTTIPSNAHNVSVWYGSNTLGQSQYGVESSGAHSGQLYIDVPTSHPRTANYTVAASSEADFTATGSELVNVNYSSDALRLVNDSLPGSYTSPSIAISSSFDIQSVTLTFNGTSTDNATSFVSDDDGLTWTPCENGSMLNFTTNGTTLRLMFNMTGNLTLGYDTSISSFQLSVVYVPLTTSFTVHVEYLWTLEFSQGETVLDLSEALPFSDGGSYLVMLYTMIGYVPSSSGLDLALDVNRTMNSYTDKDLYLCTTNPTGVASYTAVITAPKSTSNLVYYVAAVLLVLALAGAYIYGNSRRTRPEAGAAEESAAEETPAESAEAVEDRRKELVQKKKSMLSEIESIKKSLSKGDITEEEASAELSRLKNEFKGVRNELNRLSRRASVPVTKAGPETDYESVLAALARIDDDFEKGRLPENTYISLRKEYVQRAAALMAARAASTEEPLSPLQQEKNKLMEAIVALDDEREKGEIDEKVYSDLRASYRKRLAELMKETERVDEGGP